MPTQLYSLALCLEEEEKEKERSLRLDGQHSKGKKSLLLHEIFFLFLRSWRM